MAYNRRTFLKAASAVMAAQQLRAQTSAAPAPVVQTRTLNIGYEDNGNRQGFPIILLHGFPDDVRAFDGVVPPLTAAGHRVLVPYLRGYGPTRFRNASIPRMAEQAAIGQDVLDFANALALPRFAVGGFDWGGRAACIAAALFPERVRGAVICGGYTIQNIIAPAQPGPPAVERELWYQWYFNLERGRAGLAKNRRAFCRLLWETWSPDWHFTEETYNRPAPSFDNPDCVDVVIHSYRHRFALVPGDPTVEDTERKLAAQPAITVPTITLHGSDNGVSPVASSERHTRHFTGAYERRVIPGVGHNLPQEAPQAFAAAVLSLV